MNDHETMDAGRLVLGTAQFGSDYGIANTEGSVKRKQAFEILSTAWEHGIRRFDTAPAYGTEKLLGEFFRTHGVGGEAIVQTKISNIMSKKIHNMVQNSIKQSIDRLGCALDTVFFHEPNDSLQILTESDYFQDLIESDYLTNLGVSVYEPYEITRLNNSPLELSYQYPFNVIDRRFSDIEILPERGHIRSVFLQGLLVSNKQIRSDSPGYLLEFRKKYFALLECRGIDSLAFAMSFVTQSKPNSFIIFGVHSVEELQEIVSLKCSEKVHQLEAELSIIIASDRRIRDPRSWMNEDDQLSQSLE